MSTVNNTSEAIINVLDKQNKPMDINEIAFVTGSTRSAISGVIERLEKTNLIQHEENGYSLNKDNNYEELLEIFK